MSNEDNNGKDIALKAMVGVLTVGLASLSTCAFDTHRRLLDIERDGAHIIQERLEVSDKNFDRHLKRYH